jgi:hypothetical protein
MNQEIHHLLPEDFKESLSLLPEDKAITLLTRHSIREQPENYNAHYQLPLTDEGRELAKHWGALQPFEHFQLFSSPIGRCVDTAEHMKMGKTLPFESEVEVLSHLAEPGCFIKDRAVMQQVGEVFISEGPIRFLEGMLTGRFGEHIAMGERIAFLLSQFQDTHNSNTKSLNIHVSHDTILAAFVYSLLERNSFTEKDWPRMMEGVYVWFDNEHVHGVWRGLPFSKPLNQYF